MGHGRTCENNAFCAMLPTSTRESLCRGCRKRLLRAGSLEVALGEGDKALVILDGIMVSTTHEDGDETAPDSKHLFAFCLPGRLLFQNVFFDVQDPTHSAYISTESLTDCCVASFDFGFLRELYATDAELAAAMNKSAIMIMYDYANYVGILRADGLYSKLVQLLEFLTQYNLWLSNNNLAFILACDRTTVSKTLAKVRQRVPELWESYARNKHRRVEMM